LRGTTDVAPIKFTGDCRKFNLKTLEDLYKWELDASEACKISLQLENGKTYSLAQFHVHTPSEHTIKGHHYGGEIHFVHKEDGGSGLLVTGLLLNPEKDVPENAWAENVWRSMDSGKEEEVVPVDLEINYVDLLNSIVHTSHLFNYAGSLTTPPCSETVNWWVINNPLSISVSELDRLRDKYVERPSADDGRDNRPTQPLNDRKVNYY
jgi:carbonic anhydrase